MLALAFEVRKIASTAEVIGLTRRIVAMLKEEANPPASPIHQAGHKAALHRAVTRKAVPIHQAVRLHKGRQARPWQGGADPQGRRRSTKAAPIHKAVRSTGYGTSSPSGAGACPMTLGARLWPRCWRPGRRGRWDRCPGPERPSGSNRRNQRRTGRSRCPAWTPCPPTTTPQEAVMPRAPPRCNCGGVWARWRKPASAMRHGAAVGAGGWTRPICTGWRWGNRSVSSARTSAGAPTTAFALLLDRSGSMRTTDPAGQAVLSILLVLDTLPGVASWAAAFRVSGGPHPAAKASRNGRPGSPGGSPVVRHGRYALPTRLASGL